jgi:hypothetical protein
MATKKVVDKTNGSTPKTTRKARGSQANGTHTNTESKLNLASAAEVLNQEQTRSELATAAVVGAVALLIEAELLPGILLGVGAMMVAKLFPGVTDHIRPLLKTTIGMGYKAMGKAKELIAEASDHAQDIVAEIKAEAAKPMPPVSKSSGATKPSVN